MILLAPTASSLFSFKNLSDLSITSWVIFELGNSPVTND